VEAVAMKSADVVDFGDERFARRVERLHQHGPRVLYEFLCELGAQRMLRQPLEALVARYAGIDPESLAAAGGDQPLVSIAEAVACLRAARRRTLEP
jgi:hypothetical protein